MVIVIGASGQGSETSKGGKIWCRSNKDINSKFTFKVY